MDTAAAMGLVIETTYTAKAFAELLVRIESREVQAQEALFIQTWAGPLLHPTSLKAAGVSAGTAYTR